MSELLTQADEKKAALKRLIRSLHEGVDPEDAKRQFAALLQTVDATEVARIEGELISEGMPRQELRRLCDVHLAVFKDTLEKEKTQTRTPRGHPAEILKAEHEGMLRLGTELKIRAEELAAATEHGSAIPAMMAIRGIVQQLKESESHHVREENVLFPYLEKHGIMEPPAIMWSEHDKIRAVKRGIYEVVDNAHALGPAEAGRRLQGLAGSLNTVLAGHVYKENNILYPTALKVLTEQEWQETAAQFAELGYWKMPAAETPSPAEKTSQRTASPEGEMIAFETGTLPVQTVEAILDSLPVDVSFVDAEDRVRYFSNGKERIFPRAKAVIGRRVQQCHPEKSVHLVNQILSDFREGKRESAEFWIQSQGRFILIRYYPVRGKGGEYLGCLEVTQDVIGIRALEGEKRLL